MSVQAIAWVLEHSTSTGTVRLVMVGIANHVDARGEGWAYVDEVTRAANCSEESYHRAVRWAKEKGELEVEVNAGGKLKSRNDRRPNLYRLPALTGWSDCVPREGPRGGHPAATGWSDCVPRSLQSPSGPVIGAVPPPPLRTTTPPATAAKTKTKRATGVPTDFEVTPSMREWAATKGVTVDLDQETEAFLDFHRAKGSTFKDWAAAWRTWMRNTVRFAAGRRPVNGSQSALESAKARMGVK